MLQELVIAGETEVDRHETTLLAGEFPRVAVTHAIVGSPIVRASDWVSRGFDSWTFDCTIDELACEPFVLVVENDACVTRFALEVLTRCQRHVPSAGGDEIPARILRRHRALHDVSLPLVRADLNHALDVRQWMLRLEPRASATLQIAALFHDVERLVSEPRVRVEHLAADYQYFKDRHASAGATMTRELLAREGLSSAVCDEVAWLITEHERKSDVSELALLNDADALSFFSLNSPGYADYFGPEQLRKKVAYSWNRMSDRARAKLAMVRMREDVSEALASVAV